jgi:myosin-crossreactive antigen
MAAIGDRPLVVPHQSQNLAFIGNFAETERDTVFTTVSAKLPINAKFCD